MEVGPRAYPEDSTPLAVGETMAIKRADAGRERDTSEKLYGVAERQVGTKGLWTCTEKDASEDGRYNVEEETSR